MQPSVYRISLDVHDAHSGVCLDMKRQDTARQISITLTDGGFPYQISEECYAVFAATKADGKKLLHHCSIHNNTIQYIVRPQTTSAVGLCECEIKLYGAGDKLLFSPGFSILVSENALTEEDDLISEDDVDELTHLISEATTVITEGNAVNAEGEALNQESEALIADMEAKRTELEQQIADTAAHAGAANKSALAAALSSSAANDSANRAAASARSSATLAEDAQASADASKTSAQTAANMANAALQAQRAAEAAAERAEAVAARVESGELDGKDGATFTPFIVNGWLNWRNDGGRPNPASVYIRGPQGEPGQSAYAYSQEGGYTGTEEEFAEMLASGTGGGSLDITDDGQGNVTITTTGGVSVSDDGNGNVVIS